MDTDLATLLDSPLIRTGRPGNFVQLVLAEAAMHGMPGNTVAILSDLAAMLGFTDVVPEPAAKHLAAPLVNWRTHPDQPTFEQIHELNALAMNQRALIAFGGGKPGQMVGTAEIVIAVGNTYKGTTPKEYWEVFTWASLDVLRIISGDTTDEILRAKPTWTLISDDEVLKPSGRLYATYQEIATTIRREAIQNAKEHRRDFLRPLAAKWVEDHRVHRDEALAERDLVIADAITTRIDALQAMFPGLGTKTQEIERYAKSIGKRAP